MDRPHSLFRSLCSGLLLVIGVLLIPACSDSGDEGAGSSFIDLFVDDFDGGLGAWTIVQPTVAIDPAGIGRGPAMRVQQTGGAPAEARTTATFSTTGGLTVSVDIAASGSTAEFQVVNSAAPGVRDTFVRITDDKIFTSIQGQTHLLGVLPDAHVHKYLFNVDTLGNAQWQRDGIVLQHGIFAAGGIFVDCQDSGTGSSFDLVHISTP